MTGDGDVMTRAATAPATARLMVATPMYAGAQGGYVRSAIALALAAQARGMVIDFAFIMHQPSITRARNMLAHIFLHSDFTHMLFLDDDVAVEPGHVLSMLDAMQADSRLAILGGPVPKRRINWHSVARAAAAGLGRDDPSALARFTGDFAVALADPAASFALDRPVELSRLGTGLMMIRRDVIDTLAALAGDDFYVPDAEEHAGYGVGQKVHRLFEGQIEPESGRLLSDDYAFCQRARAAGFSIWLAPWVTTTHTGPVTFGGSLSDLALLGNAAARPPQ